ncbi:hypothetical protein GLYMA_15G053201v4 [Glycine max]|nr:hypothetical protein GLYMA_15G053201v4 [Glycine max]KAH1145694.1 hypothetical protein GYH30_041417 [Glycine max]
MTCLMLISVLVMPTSNLTTSASSSFREIIV